MENIILLHGALGASSDLEPLSGKLKQRGFTVFSFSFSGHGKTAFQSEFGIEQFGKELEELIHSNKLAKANVFGYSMGGYVALHLAQKQNGLLNKVITLGTKFNWSDEAVTKETKQLNAELIFQKVPAFAKALEEKHGTWKELLSATADMMWEINKAQYISAESLKQISIPVLIGLADKDQMVTLDETISVYKTLPNASMYMLPGTKHPLETANPELLSMLISDFIRK